MTVRVSVCGLRSSVCSEVGQTTTEYLMVAGLLTAIIVTVFVLIYWPSVKEPARQTMGNCVPSVIKGSLDGRCAGTVAARPVSSPRPDASNPPLPSTPPATTVVPPSDPPPPTAATTASVTCVSPGFYELYCQIDQEYDPQGFNDWQFSPQTTCDLSRFRLVRASNGTMMVDGVVDPGAPCELVVTRCNAGGECVNTSFPPYAGAAWRTPGG